MPIPGLQLALDPSAKSLVVRILFAGVSELALHLRLALGLHLLLRHHLRARLRVRHHLLLRRHPPLRRPLMLLDNLLVAFLYRV